MSHQIRDRRLTATRFRQPGPERVTQVVDAGELTLGRANVQALEEVAHAGPEPDARVGTKAGRAVGHERRFCGQKREPAAAARPGLAKGGAARTSKQRRI